MYDANTKASLKAGGKNAAVTLWTTPTSSAASSVPRMLPKPPSATTAYARPGEERRAGGGRRGAQLSQDAPEAAGRDDGVREDSEGESCLRVDGEEVGKDDAGDRDQRRAQAPGHRVHALGPDADQHRGVPILRRGLEREA